VIRESLRPARPVLWIAVPVAVVLLATLVALAKLAGADPGVRLQRELEGAGLRDVSVEIRPGAADPRASHIRVTYRSDDLDPAGAAQQAEVALRTVWHGFDGRIDSVSVQERGPAAVAPGDSVTAAELQRTMGDRPVTVSDAGYASTRDRAARVTVLALLAVLTTFVLVLCAAIAAVLVVRRGPRRPDPGV
jgi:hypothetical protein